MRYKILKLISFFHKAEDRRKKNILDKTIHFFFSFNKTKGEIKNKCFFGNSLFKIILYLTFNLVIKRKGEGDYQRFMQGFTWIFVL